MNTVVTEKINVNMKQQTNKPSQVVARLTVGLLWLGWGADYVAAAKLGGSAPVNRITARMSNERVCRTLATEPVTIPDTGVVFTQGGTTPEEVVVTFVAEWPRPSDNEIPAGSRRAGAFIFLLIDGKRADLSNQGRGVLVHEGTASFASNGTHGFTFVTRPIPPGMHNARIQFLDILKGEGEIGVGTVCVSDRSTVVQHR